MKPVLTLAHSADADDVFMWWPITGKIDPADPARVVEPPAIDTGRFAYRAVPEDIQKLNRRAIEAADLDITAVSFATYAHVADRYRATACGASFGDDWGPKLVARVGAGVADARTGTGAPAPAGRRLRVAVPGINTTAYTVLCVVMGRETFEPVEMPFDRIMGAVVAGETELGLVIHEGQFIFQREGLEAVADLGVLWKQATGGPLPLGANVVRRDLDARFGPGSLEEVGGMLRASIDHALAHRAEGLAYARGFSPLQAISELDRYVNTYVNPLTVDAGEVGRRAIERLLLEGWRLGLLPRVDGVDLL